MARAPFNVLVIPFLRKADGVRYCAFKRGDGEWWQWIAGGGEDEETPLEAAARESLEEAGISGKLFRLSSEARIPVSSFQARDSWPSDLYVIPEYHWALEATSSAITLSHEHTESRWASYDESFVLLRWQSNQTALWELSERLKRGDLASVELR